MAKPSVVKTAPQKFHRDQIIIYILLFPVVLVMLLPVVYIVFHAFKPIDELFAFPPRFFTKRPTLDNFRMLFGVAEVSSWPVSLRLFNSIVSTGAVVAATVLMSAAAGYVLSKKDFKGKRALQQINQAALMFVPIAVAVPRFLMIKQLGLMDSFLSHILPQLAMPVGLFLVQQFIDQVPDSLLEAARLDGCSDYGILFRIVMPVIKPALATVAILSFQQAWTATEASQMFIDNEKLKTFAYFVASVTAPTGSSLAGQAMSAAAALITFVPVIVLFVIMQSKVVNTVAHSGIK